MDLEFVKHHICFDNQMEGIHFLLDPKQRILEKVITSFSLPYLGWPTCHSDNVLPLHPPNKGRFREVTDGGVP